MPSEPSEQGTVRYIRCPACGAPNPGTEAICGRCGKPLQSSRAAMPSRPATVPATDRVNCPKCGKPLPVGSKFCGFCGASLLPVTPQPPARVPEKPVPSIPPVAPRVSPPASKPLEPMAPPARPVVAPPVHPTPIPPIPVAPAPPRPAARPGSVEGTQLFTGIHVPAIEATISEVKPDGSTGRSVRLTKETFIGRGACDLTYPNDVLLAPRHASLVVREGKLLLKDQGSQNGTFLKQRQDTELAPGDVFLLGRELFRFATQSLDEGQNPAAAQGTYVMMGAPKLQRGPVTAKLEHIQLTGETIEEFKLEKPETTLGRTTGDLVFQNDPYMSGTHARIVAQPGRFVLQDLKSRNGVYRKIRGEVDLRDSDEFFLGEQLFRATIKIT